MKTIQTVWIKALRNIWKWTVIRNHRCVLIFKTGLWYDVAHASGIPAYEEKLRELLRELTESAQNIFRKGIPCETSVWIKEEFCWPHLSYITLWFLLAQHQIAAVPSSFYNPGASFPAQTLENFYTLPSDPCMPECHWSPSDPEDLPSSVLHRNLPRMHPTKLPWKENVAASRRNKRPTPSQ